MVNSLEVVLVPALMIIGGILFKKFDILKEEHSSLLSKIVLNISLPSLIFINISTANISGQMIYLPFISLGISFICMLIAFIYSKLRGYSKVKTWTLIILLSMVNTAFIGYPIVLGVFGKEGFLNAIFYDMMVALLFVLFGIILSTIFGGNRKEVVKNGLTFVPLWAIIFGLIFNIFNIPLGYVVENTLTYLSNLTIPLIMLSLGLTINFIDFKSYLSDTIFVTFSRLLLAPLLLYVILLFIGFDGLILKVCIGIGYAYRNECIGLAVSYDLDVELVRAVIFVTTIACLVTLPVIISII